MPTVEVLVAAMHQTDDSLYETMNLQTDAVIANQCERADWQRAVKPGGKTVTLISSADRGVGKNRNTALLAATGDICLIADEDMIYVDGYEKIILDAFERRPEADAIFFTLQSLNKDRPSAPVVKNGRLRRTRATGYGASHMAVRRQRLLRANCWFSLCFGGGAQYGSGEDSLFIWDLFRKRLRVYACPDKIADVRQEVSSWFSGYNDKYFFDRGALRAAMAGRLARPVSLYSGVKMYLRLGRKIKLSKIIGLMFKGIDDYNMKS